MTTQRDSLYPPSSIGRAQGANIVRTPSREALAVHPLLGDSSSNAKYVPYTPRQRPTSTISATVQVVASPPPSQSTVPSKPPLANLKTTAQNIGLEANSIGWAILEKISYEGDTSDEWTDVWNALTKARATLLLPAEPTSASDAITHEFVQDHVVFCDLASKDNTAVVTLSGLRGHLANDSLTFRSTLHRSTKPFQAILTPPTSRSASLDALPPLPVFPPQSSYPSFSVSAFTAALPLPSRATKPPLPPRPGTTRGSSARLPIHLASLFGQRPSTPPPSLPSTPTVIPTPTVEPEPSIDITAFVIDTPLNRSDIATGIISALKSEIAVALADQPPWLVERVHAFALACFPFVRLPAGKKKLQDIGGNPNRIVYAVNGALDKSEELADRFQAFYAAVESELRRGAQKHGEDGGDVSGPQEPGAEQAGKEEEEEANEAHIRDVLETVESTLCTLLYDRLFLPSTSDDASHNEALSSRVAALNMLDLGLEHLDIDVSNANYAEVDAVVRLCGQTLAQLDLTARSPREKAAVLVSAHKLVVEGLSKIPPIRLRSRDDDGENPTRHPAAAPVPSIQDSSETQSLWTPTVHLTASPDQQSTVKLPPAESVPPSTTSSPVSGDVLLPILIFSVVKANPSRLVSHLLFIQRFRNQCFGGEESYCLINLMAVAEFLENVDLGALGLGESEKVLSTADLTPIPIAITRSSEPSISVGTGAGAVAATTAGMAATDENLANLRGRVGQGVDAIAGSANKVISGVVDTSFGVLRAFLPGQAMAQNQSVVSGGLARGVGEQGSTVAGASAATGSGSGETDAALWGVRPSFGLLRRDTGFSIAGLTAALPGGGGSSSLLSGRARTQTHPEEVGQRELVEVTSGSRPASLRSHRSGYDGEAYGDGEEDAEEEDEEDGEASEEEESGEDEGDPDAVEGEDGVVEDGQEESGEEEGEKEEEEEGGEVHDTRSIKSFESMLSGGRPRKGQMVGVRSPSSTSVTGAVPASVSASTQRRKRLTNLTDRFTHGMAGMSRRVVQGPGDRDAHRATTMSGSIIPLPSPNRRFVECTEQDIRVSEVGELLREYQRLVEAVRSVGGFREGMKE